MKQLMIVLLGSLVVGCASTGDLEKANTKIADLEKKVAALEKKHEQVDPLSRSLGRRSNTNTFRYSSVSTNTTLVSSRERQMERLRTDESAAARREEERAAREAEREAQKAQLQARMDQLLKAHEERVQSEKKEKEKREAAERAKYAKSINAFVKEYLGVQFGDSIERFPEQKRPDDEDDYEEWELNLWERMELESLPLTPTWRHIPVVKKFGYFNMANAWFLDGKLFYVELVACLDNKYSVESCDAQNQNVISNFAACVNMTTKDIISLDSLKVHRAEVCGGLRDWGFRPWVPSKDAGVKGDFCVGRSSEVRADGRYYKIGIFNWRLGKEYAAVVEKRERTQGETLPEPK